LQLRGTAEKHAGLTGINMVSAWSADNDICLGHIQVEDGSNEIPTVPKLMDKLELTGTIITVDAMNTQKATAAKACEKGAYYVMPIKENHPELLKDIEDLFKSWEEDCAHKKNILERNLEKARAHRDKEREKQLLARGLPNCGACIYEPEIEKGHGRIETRRYTALSVDKLPTAQEWQGMRSVTRVERVRETKEKKETNTTYYVAALSHKDSKKIADAIRGHWSIENRLHLRLDVCFHQDHLRYRERVGSRNMATFRKIVLNVLTKDASVKRSIKGKQILACCNPQYREHVLKIVLKGGI
jgi:predicted transposase YbfD/YdcC